MSSSLAASGAPRTSGHGSISIPVLVLAAALIGLGIAGLAYWLVVFQWLYLASVIPLALGGLLLFTPLTGPDRA